MEITLKKTISRDLTNKLAWFLFLLSILVGLIPIYRWIWERWTGYESYFSHGPLVVLISLYFLWKERRILLDSSNIFWSQARPWHYILLIGLSLLYLLFALIKVYFILALAVWGFLVLGLDASLKKDVIKRIWFPLFFLVLSIPFPMVVSEQLALVLKNLSAKIAGALLTAIGIVTKVTGNRLYTPYAMLEVGAPCSGLRSIVSLFTLSILFSYINKFSLKRSLVLIATSPLVAFIGNIFRVFSLGFVADIYGTEVAMGRFHDTLGYVIFVLDLVILFIVAKILSIRKRQ